MANPPDDQWQPIPSELAQADAAFAEMVEDFVTGLGARINEIAGAAQARDFEQLRTLAHQLRGSAGGYGYPVLARKAAEMELHAVAEELEVIGADVKELEQLVARVVVRF